MFSIRFWLALILGIVLFVSDLFIGWLTALTGRFPVVIVMGFIIGLVARRGIEAVLASVLSWSAGIVISVLIGMVAYPGQIPPDATLVGLLLTAAVMALRGTFQFEYEGPWIIALPVIIIYMLIIFVVTPAIYLMAVVTSMVGGIVGHALERVIKPIVERTREKHLQPEQERPAQVQPEQEQSDQEQG